MGDCRIRIVIAKDLLSKESQKKIQTSVEKGDKVKDVIVAETPTAMSWIRIFSADTTVREVAQGTPELWKLYSSSSSCSSWKDLPFQLWDCTIHPPTDISDWPTDTFSEMTGPKSKTLHDAGCFPSGTWIALPRGVTPRQFSNTNYEDAQYNRQGDLSTAASSGKLSVEFKDPSLVTKFQASSSSKPLPSQVMASVAQRFEEENLERETQAPKARALRLENQEQLRKRQRERTTKLDRRIKMLEDQSSEKNKKVSNQVHRMLVKSRATGDKRLKQQDRLYFECLLDLSSAQDEDEEAIVREFRYFSPQDTFAKIGASFEGPYKQKGKDVNVEVLVKQRNVGGNDHGSTSDEYRRFPVAMRVYEAIAEKFLTGDHHVDTLIIRWYSGDSSDASPSILDTQDKLPSIPMAESPNDDVEMIDATFSKDLISGNANNEKREPNASSLIVDETLTAAILAMDEATNKGRKPKKTSAAAMKVRNMQMKSKAKGDVKRIPKVEDRFFLEVVKLNGGAGKASASFEFLANKDPVERIVQSVASSTATTDWDFFVPQTDGEATTYCKILDTSIELADAAAKSILKPFDRLILRPK